MAASQSRPSQSTGAVFTKMPLALEHREPIPWLSTPWVSLFYTVMRRLTLTPHYLESTTTAAAEVDKIRAHKKLSAIKISIFWSYSIVVLHPADSDSSEFRSTQELILTLLIEQIRRLSVDHYGLVA